MVSVWLSTVRIPSGPPSVQGFAKREAVRWTTTTSFLIISFSCHHDDFVSGNFQPRLRRRGCRPRDGYQNEAVSSDYTSIRTTSFCHQFFCRIPSFSAGVRSCGGEVLPADRGVFPQLDLRIGGRGDHGDPEGPGGLQQRTGCGRCGRVAACSRNGSERTLERGAGGGRGAVASRALASVRYRILRVLLNRRPQRQRRNAVGSVPSVFFCSKLACGGTRC